MVFRLELTRQILSVESIKLPPDSQNGQIDFYQTARDSKGTNIKQSEWNGGIDDFKITCLLILPFIMIKHFNHVLMYKVYVQYMSVRAII